MTSREYKLFLTRSQKLAVVLPAIMVVLVAVFAGFYVSRILTLPYQITVTRDAQLVFKSVVRSRSVRARDVLSIEPHHLNIQAGVSGYLLKHREGKLRFPGQFTDQYRLLYELKEANPAVELKGC